MPEFKEDSKGLKVNVDDLGRALIPMVYLQPYPRVSCEDIEHLHNHVLLSVCQVYAHQSLEDSWHIFNKMHTRNLWQTTVDASYVFVDMFANKVLRDLFFCMHCVWRNLCTQGVRPNNCWNFLFVFDDSSTAISSVFNEISVDIRKILQHG